MSISAVPGAPLGPSFTITAVLPQSLRTHVVVDSALTAPAWEELPVAARTVECLASSGNAADAEAASANVLVLVDGIPDEMEQLTLSRILARQLRLMQPFSWIGDKVLLWGLPLASRESGGTVRWLSDRAAGSPMPVSQPKPPPEAGAWGLPHVVHAAGPAIPEPTGGWPSREDQIDRWSVQLPFSAEELADRIDGPVYDAWRLLTATRLPLNERDTALGVIQGSRAEDDRYTIGLAKQHMSRFELNRLLSVLVDRTGAPMGDRWVAGDDRQLVVVVSGGHKDAGCYAPPDELVVMSAEDTGAHPLVAARSDARGTDLTGADWPKGGKQATPELRAVFAHELGHALLLGDEYGGLHQLPATWTWFADEEANLQVELGPDGLSNGTALQGDRIRWNHPRIARAFVLRDEAPIAEVSAQSADPVRELDGRLAYAVQLEPGQLQSALTDGFDLVGGDHPVLFMRTRARLTDRLDEWQLSPAVDLAGAEPSSDVVYVREQAPGALAPFASVVMSPQGLANAPILFVPVPKAVEADGWARLVPKRVRDHVTRSKRPLDAPSLKDQAAAWTCPEHAAEVDAGWPKMTNRPPLPKGKPFFPARRIPAVWTGGSLYDCGLFHPTSHSIMRGHVSRKLLSPAPSDVYVPRGDVPLPLTGEVNEFDPVANYLLIDRLDPTRHHELEHYLALRDPD